MINKRKERKYGRKNMEGKMKEKKENGRRKNGRRKIKTGVKTINKRKENTEGKL